MALNGVESWDELSVVCCFAAAWLFWVWVSISSIVLNWTPSDLRTSLIVLVTNSYVSISSFKLSCSVPAIRSAMVFPIPGCPNSFKNSKPCCRLSFDFCSVNFSKFWIWSGLSVKKRLHVLLEAAWICWDLLSTCLQRDSTASLISIWGWSSITLSVVIPSVICTCFPCTEKIKADCLLFSLLLNFVGCWQISSFWGLRPCFLSSLNALAIFWHCSMVPRNSIGYCPVESCNSSIGTNLSSLDPSAMVCLIWPSKNSSKWIPFSWASLMWLSKAFSSQTVPTSLLSMSFILPGSLRWDTMVWMWNQSFKLPSMSGFSGRYSNKTASLWLNFWVNSNLRSACSKYLTMPNIVFPASLENCSSSVRYLISLSPSAWVLFSFRSSCISVLNSFPLMSLWIVDTNSLNATFTTVFSPGCCSTMTSNSLAMQYASCLYLLALT